MNKKKRNVLCKLALIMAMVMVFLTACGTNNSDTNTTAEGDVTEISFTWWGDTERHERYNAIVALFEAENPDVKVVTEPANWSDYWTRLSTQSAGGNAPTLFGMHPQYVSDYALRGALANLEEFVENGTIAVDKIETAVVDSGRVNGELLMVSQGVTFQGFLANRTLLEKHGATIPASDEDWTWEEFVQAARDYTESANATGVSAPFVADQTGTWLVFRYYARQLGGDVFTEDGQLGFEEERLVAYFEMWNELREMGAVPDQATVTEDEQRALEQKILANNGLGMQVWPANQLPLYQSVGGGSEYDMLRIPVTQGQVQRAEYIEGAYFAVSENATDAQKEAAARLIHFFVNTEEASDIFKMEQGVPANTVLAERVMTDLSEDDIKVVSYVSALMSIADTGVYPPLGAQEINTLFMNVGERVSHGLLTPQEAAAQFMNEANAILEREQ